MLRRTTASVLRLPGMADERCRAPRTDSPPSAAAKRELASHGGSDCDPGEDERPGVPLREVEIVCREHLLPRLLLQRPPEPELERDGERDPDRPDPRRVRRARDRPSSLERLEVEGERANQGGGGDLLA